MNSRGVRGHAAERPRREEGASEGLRQSRAAALSRGDSRRECRASGDPSARPWRASTRAATSPRSCRAAVPARSAVLDAVGVVPARVAHPDGRLAGLVVVGVDGLLAVLVREVADVGCRRVPVHGRRLAAGRGVMVGHREERLAPPRAAPRHCRRRGPARCASRSSSPGVGSSSSPFVRRPRASSAYVRTSATGESICRASAESASVFLRSCACLQDHCRRRTSSPCSASRSAASGTTPSLARSSSLSWSASRWPRGARGRPCGGSPCRCRGRHRPRATAPWLRRRLGRHATDIADDHLLGRDGLAGTLVLDAPLPPAAGSR